MHWGDGSYGEVQPWSAERVKAERRVTHRRPDRPSFGFLVNFRTSLNPGRGGCSCPRLFGTPGHLSDKHSVKPHSASWKSGPRTGTGTQGHPQTRGGAPWGTSLCLLAAGGLEPLGAEPGRGPGLRSPLEAGGGTDGHRVELDGGSGTRKPGQLGLLRSCSAGEQGPS